MDKNPFAPWQHFAQYVHTPLEITGDITAALDAFLRRDFDLHTISNIPYPGNLAGNVFRNVEAQFDALGGEVLYGWSVRIWPRVLLVLQPYAVWLDENGDYCDITPHNHPGETTMFLPDVSVMHNRAKGVQPIGTQHLPLRKDYEVMELVRIANECSNYINAHGPLLGGTDFELMKRVHAVTQALNRIHHDVEPDDPCTCGAYSKAIYCCHAERVEALG